MVLIRSAKYFDKIKGDEITIDLNDEMANILDWCYRGDPLANLELVCQLRTLNNNGEVSLSREEPFTFYSSETVDVIHGRNYYRRTMQIPGAFFNRLNSFEVLGNFGMPGVNISKLLLFNDNLDEIRNSFNERSQKVIGMTFNDARNQLISIWQNIWRRDPLPLHIIRSLPIHPDRWIKTITDGVDHWMIYDVGNWDTVILRVNYRGIVRNIDLTHLDFRIFNSLLR
jgi:hypothetical protein